MPSAIHAETVVPPLKADRKLNDESNILGSDVSLPGSIPSHPLGVKPLGNQYISEGRNARGCIGTWQVVPDEILSVIVEFTGKESLLALGHTCKFFYAFCHLDELWKALFLRIQPSAGLPVKWRGSWRATVLNFPEGYENDVNIDCKDVFSDVLHRPFACSKVALPQYTSRIPKRNQIQRLENLTYEEFAEGWTRQPFILTKCIEDWPVTSQWSIDEMLRLYGRVEFRAEAVDWTFSTYCKYMEKNYDESPLYLFDRSFAEKMRLTVGQVEGAAYWRPECFGPDFFEVLGDERPAHRWLIIGPERSGSTFHKDPNGTSAWNAVIQGAKYWIMFPPSAQVPGVYVSADSSEVTSPLSIAEWLLTFHEEARQLPECVEGICYAGEILHVPSGWWHLVVNLEDGIALTQNFVPQSPSLHHLSEVLSFLRDKPDQVSGFKDQVENPYELFTQRLQQKYPETLGRALDMLDAKNGKKRKWDAAVGKDDDGPSTGFSFGFGGDDLEDEEVP